MDIESRIMSDLMFLGYPTDFKLSLRGYSKKYYSRYKYNLVTGESKMIIYTLNENGELYDYDIIFALVIHELSHHYQWVYDDSFVRVKGVMHNHKFNEIAYSYYLKAENAGIVKPNSRERRNELVSLALH